MKKRLVWSAIVAAALAAAFWAAAQLAPARSPLAALFPDNALLYIEARDFGALLKDWNHSEQKRIWLEGDNFRAFSRSRLFERLSRAQDEFSAAATITAGNDLLSSVAGTQSALALYDIGNLEFVYVTRMNQAQVDATPLWQVRAKFELRSEGTAQFYVRQEQQSNRTAAFAARDGWLVLGTRADLVAGVLDRVQGAHTHNLPDEAWYADALGLAPGPAGDLRMVLNLEKLVPSPYFRSYWVQNNITEMKQYRAALCDLHRAPQEYREDRVLLRKAGTHAPIAADADAEPLLRLVPDEAVFSSAEAAPPPERILAELRENLLDLKPVETRAAWSAPPAVAAENAGSAAMLEERIDIAPVVAARSDPYQPLRALITAAQPDGLLEVYTTRFPSDGVFVNIDRGIVIQGAAGWSETAVQSALANALRPGLTASQLGIEWVQRSGASGAYFALDGQVAIYLAIRENQLFITSSEPLLNSLLSRSQASPPPQPRGITYTAWFRHAPREQDTFRELTRRLDTAHVTNPAEGDTQDPNGRAPSFFSENVASLSRVFANVASERIEEKDEGASVTQTVVYQWQ